MNIETDISLQRNITMESRKKAKRKKVLGNYLFILPGGIFLLLFLVFPIGYNLKITFEDLTALNILKDQSFVGLENYATVLKDKIFLLSLKNSVIFTGLCIFFQFTIGFAFALFFNKKFPGRNVMRALILIAWMIPLVITGTLFKWMFAGDHGIINHLFMWLGLIDQPIHWLINDHTSLYSTIIANIWIGIPFNMIILLAGLQSLPEETYEAAKVDGAGKVRQFFSITLPLMKPTILTLLVLGIIYTFKVFDIILIMTGGGPVNSSTVLPFYSYEMAFTNYNFSLGATVNTIMLGLLILVALVYLWLVRKEENV
ncbi:carbohydrate ABC transporter permease [Fictibacillus fluitans]|uniref:Sugar ABC transporter permease n=1 Tax=Fictibacillus fluitans TaxID=3058422 RepID=A0ABT8HQB2_9BACL|nr:sugar ABC transporter permease [Fictibacillus sp. NE201]MDN4522959.1 sugar ABC transporter permease [Fictibacillus sp. NE201]